MVKIKQEQTTENKICFQLAKLHNFCNFQSILQV